MEEELSIAFGVDVEKANRQLLDKIVKAIVIGSLVMCNRLNNFDSIKTIQGDKQVVIVFSQNLYLLTPPLLQRVFHF